MATTIGPAMRLQVRNDANRASAIDLSVFFITDPFGFLVFIDPRSLPRLGITGIVDIFPRLVPQMSKKCYSHFYRHSAAGRCIFSTSLLVPRIRVSWMSLAAPRPDRQSGGWTTLADFRRPSAWPETESASWT